MLNSFFILISDIIEKFKHTFVQFRNFEVCFKWFLFYAPPASARRWHKAFGCPYVRAYVHPSVHQVKNVVQGRISRLINGSKLIFHMRMYLHDQQEYMSHDLYFTVHWLWNIGSIWCRDFPHKIYVRQWPTFHGPVILSYILKTFRWRMLYWRYWFSATLSLAYK